MCSKSREYAPLTMHERVGMYVRGFDVSDIAKRVTRMRAHCTVGAGSMRKVNVLLVEREENDGVCYNMFLNSLFTAFCSVRRSNIHHMLICLV
jgi:hypothetical protein